MKMNEVGDLQKRNAASGKSNKGPSCLFKVVDIVEAPPWSPHNVPLEENGFPRIQTKQWFGFVTKLKVKGHFPFWVDLI